MTTPKRHPCQPQLPSDIENEWEAAKQDVVGLKRDVVLLLRPGSECETMRYRACWFHPRRKAEPVVPDAVLDALNDRENGCINTHRILLWADNRPIEMNAALLRHELQHALQYESAENLPKLHELAEGVIRMDDLNFGRLYNQMPMERDANHAASEFVRGRFDSKAIDALADNSDYQALLRSSAASKLSSLPDAIVKYLADLPDLCREYAANGNGGDDLDATFEDFLSLAYGSKTGGNSWRELVSDT